MIINDSSGFGALGVFTSAINSALDEANGILIDTSKTIAKYSAAANRIGANATFGRLGSSLGALKGQISTDPAGSDFFVPKIRGIRDSLLTLRNAVLVSENARIEEEKAAAAAAVAKTEADKKAAEQARVDAEKAERAARRAAEKAREEAEEAARKAAEDAATAKAKTQKIMTAAGLVLALTLGVVGYNYFKRR